MVRRLPTLILLASLLLGAVTGTGALTEIAGTPSRTILEALPTRNATYPADPVDSHVHVDADHRTPDWDGLWKEDPAHPVLAKPPAYSCDPGGIPGATPERPPVNLTVRMQTPFPIWSADGAEEDHRNRGVARIFRGYQWLIPEIRGDDAGRVEQVWITLHPLRVRTGDTPVHGGTDPRDVCEEVHTGKPSYTSYSTSHAVRRGDVSPDRGWVVPFDFTDLQHGLYVVEIDVYTRKLGFGSGVADAVDRTVPDRTSYVYARVGGTHAAEACGPLLLCYDHVRARLWPAVYPGDTPSQGAVEATVDVRRHLFNGWGERVEILGPQRPDGTFARFQESCVAGCDSWGTYPRDDARHARTPTPVLDDGVHGNFVEERWSQHRHESYGPLEPGDRLLVWTTWDQGHQWIRKDVTIP